MMLILYNGNGGGSQEARLVSKVNSTHWWLIRKNAARILRNLMGDKDAAEALEKFPLELWEGTNGFGDKFHLLHMRVPISQYMEIEQEADTYQGRARFQRIADVMALGGDAIRFIGMEADTENSAVIATPLLQTKSVAVTRALADFELLISSKGGPTSGLDRIHTALHGYLRAVCDDAGIQYPANADITGLFGLIRGKHPKLQAGPPGIEGTKILRAMAQVVDALNPVRNHHSLAHPSEELLDEPEALLAVNAAKCLLHYLSMKLRSVGDQDV